MFVLQIGSVSQTDSCNAALDQADTVDRAVLLQYSVNNGVSWHVIAQHQPKDFIKAQRVSYNIPLWVCKHALHEFHYYLHVVLVALTVEYGANNVKIMGSIPMGCMNW